MGNPSVIVADRYREKELLQELESASFPVSDFVLRGMGFRDGSEVAKKYGRTIRACTTRYNKLRTKRGQWTDVGLWTPEEDNLILAQIPLYGRVADGTWVSVAEILTNRTLAAIRVRAWNLRRWGKVGGGK